MQSFDEDLQSKLSNSIFYLKKEAEFVKSLQQSVDVIEQNLKRIQLNEEKFRKYARRRSSVAKK